MKCQCAKCSDSPSKTFSESWRVETEARYWLNKPLSQRREYLDAKPVQARRKALEAELIRQHAARKQ